MSQKLSFELKGDKDNPRVVFLHGFMGSVMSWDCFAEDYDSLLFDLPYHGRSVDIQLDWDETVVVLSEQIRELCTQPVHLIGYSLGARIALQLILKHPALFSGATLESVNPGIFKNEERRERQKLENKWAEHIREDFSSFIDFWLEQDMFKGLKKNTNVRTRHLMNDPVALSKSLKALGTGTMPSLWDAIETLKIPVQLIVGDRDICFIRHALRMCQLQSLFSLEIISEAGHNVHEEQTQAYTKALNMFIEGILV